MVRCCPNRLIVYPDFDRVWASSSLPPEVLGAGNDGQYERLCVMMEGEVPALRDPRFRTNPGRVEHRVELLTILQTELQTHPTQYWLDLIGDKLPCAPVNSVGETLEDPQVRHRDMVRTVDHPTIGKLDLVGIPVKYRNAEVDIRRPPPLLGQHTDSVLAEVAGLAAEDIERLRAEGAV